MTATTANLAGAEAIVAGWRDAFNARDVVGLIGRASVEIELRPIRLPGVQRTYRGHDGIRAWIDDLTRAGHDHRVTTSDIRNLDDGRVLATGVIDLHEAPGDTQWCGTYRVSHGRITHVRSYLSEPALLTYLGLLD